MQKNWRELIKPKRLEIETTEPNTYGKFECEPLERGFGITMGNALRRVLLSSLQGSAITNVKIDGVLHEFSTIPGVLEDVTDVILNLKEVRFKLTGDGNLRRLQIEKQGEGRVCGRGHPGRGDGRGAQSRPAYLHPCQGRQTQNGTHDKAGERVRSRLKKISRKTSLSERSPSTPSFRRCAKSTIL